MTTVYVTSGPREPDDATERRQRSGVRTQLGAILGTERRLDLVIADDGVCGIEAASWCQEHRVPVKIVQTWDGCHDDAPAVRDALALAKGPSWVVDVVGGREDWPASATVRRVGGAR